MKAIYACTIIGSMLMSAVVNTTAAQALPSEKPVNAYYSKPVAQKMAVKKTNPVSAGQRNVVLPSVKAGQAASLPEHMKQKTVVRPRYNQRRQANPAVLPANRPVDMDRIRKQKALANRQ